MYRKDRFFLIGISTFALLFTVVCSLTAPQVIVVTATPGPAEAEVTVTIPEESPMDTQTVEPVQPTVEGAAPPNPTSAPANPGTSQGGCNVNEAAWVGSFGYGLNCIDSAGWHTFLPEESGLSGDQIKAIAVCADNTAWIVSGLGVDSTDGMTWQNHSEALGRFSSAEAVACDSRGGVWVAHYKGAHYFDGSTWTEYKSSLMGNGDFVDQVKGVTVAPDGSAWFVTSNSVAKFDGSAWTVFETGNGFSKDYYFTAIAADPQGNIWAAHGSGIWKYDGSNWTNQEGKTFSQVQSLTVDQQGHLWAGTYSKGLNLFNGQGWVNYNRQNSGLSSNHVRSLSADGNNRIWIGTEWGLDVFDGKDWKNYHMHNSDLTDNEVYAVAVGGQGPSLPEWTDKGMGSLTGKIVRGEEGVSNARIEVCTEYIGMIFSGPTPCSDNPLRQETTTGPDGAFLFAELPVGRYSIALQTPEGQWMYLTEGFHIGNQDLLVESGQETNLHYIDISQEG
jgi:hypothetical protein